VRQGRGLLMASLMHQTRCQYMSDAEACDATTANSGGQQLPEPVTIAFALYPGSSALDITDPFRVLSMVPGHEAVFVAAEAGPGHRRHRPLPAHRIHHIR
jgi:hypothetical protein